MPNPYGWGQNEPQIMPKDQGGDTIATFSTKIKNAISNLFDALNTYPWSNASNFAAGYMSAEDKANLDKLLAYDTASSVASPDYDNLASGASFEYRTLGAMAMINGYGKFLSATSRYSGRRVATGVPAVTWNGQPRAYLYFDSSTYYGAWVTVDVNGNVYVTTRDVAIPANSLFYFNIMYPRAL